MITHRIASFVGVWLCCALPGCVPLAEAGTAEMAVLRAGLRPVADAPSAPAAPALSAEDTRDIRAVIQTQLDAFAADDAEAAFGQAAPEIRDMFGTPERFMSMVREQYPVVYRPVSVSYLPAEATPAGVIQGVRMQDDSGTQWLAAYLMLRQGDKRWRIGGCQLIYEGKGLTT